MRFTFFLYFCTFVFISCSEKGESVPGTAAEVGAAFIRASLNGDFKQAETFLLDDRQNVELFTSYEQYHSKLPPEVREKYKLSSYTINEFTDQNDSTAIINYSNDFMKMPMELKLVRKDGTWRVDFRHTPAMENL